MSIEELLELLAYLAYCECDVMITREDDTEQSA